MEPTVQFVNGRAMKTSWACLTCTYLTCPSFGKPSFHSKVFSSFRVDKVHKKWRLWTLAVRRLVVIFNALHCCLVKWARWTIGRYGLQTCALDNLLRYLCTVPPCTPTAGTNSNNRRIPSRRNGAAPQPNSRPNLADVFLEKLNDKHGYRQLLLEVKDKWRVVELR